MSSIELLLVRHGQAVDDAPGLGDPARWLTSKGRAVSRRVARWLADEPARRPSAIWTSPLVRAVQTAEILAEAAELAEVEVRGELAFGDPAALLALVRGHDGPGPLALVGHEPSLSETATLLLGDVAFPGFRKSGVLSVGWNRQGKATLRFLLEPKAMLVHTSLP